MFGAQARFPATSVTVSGESREYVRAGDSGRRLRFRFCPECGSTVLYTIEDLPEIVAIPLGAFADPSFPAPRFSVYEDRKHAWVAVPEDVEHSR